MNQPPKFPTVSVAAALAASALLLTVPTVPDYLFDLVAVCDTPTNPGITGIIWSAGNHSGQYTVQYVSPPTNSFTFPGLDSRLPWFVTAQTYQTNEFYDVQCLTNDDGSLSCATNFSNVGPPALEQMTIGRDAMPTMQLVQNVPVLMWYGATNRTYWIRNGPDFADAMTNLFGPVPGTNGLQMIAHFGPEPSWFFETQVQ